MVQPLHRPGKITVFGGATVDRIAASLAKPIMGVSNPGTARSDVGGVGLNVASILSRLGLATRLVTRVGHDADGEAILSTARREGVDLTGVTVSAAAATAAYIATLDDAGDLVIGIAAMAICDELTPPVVTAAMSGDDSSIWVMDANLPPETITSLLERAAASGRRVAAMPVSPAKAVRLRPVLDRFTYLFANRYEAAALLGRAAADDTPTDTLAESLSGLGIPHVAITAGGGRAAVAIEGSPIRSFAPPPVPVTNVNGAGDSLAAGTLFGIAEGKSFVEAFPFGLAAAAMTLESGGVHKAAFDPDPLRRRAGKIGGVSA